MSTFGKTSLGSSSGSFSSNIKRVNAYTLGTAAAISKLTIYLQPTLVAGTQYLKGLIYADSNGAPGALLATSTQLTFSQSLVPRWYDLPLATPLTVNPGRYWIGTITSATGGVMGFRWDYVANARYRNSDAYSDGASTPFGLAVIDGEQISIYATYTVPAPPVNLTPPVAA